MAFNARFSAESETKLPYYWSLISNRLFETPVSGSRGVSGRFYIRARTQLDDLNGKTE